MIHLSSRKSSAYEVSQSTVEREKSDIRRLTNLEVEEWNFELQNILAPLEYLSPEYMKKAREFRSKKLGKYLPPDHVERFD